MYVDFTRPEPRGAIGVGRAGLEYRRCPYCDSPVNTERDIHVCSSPYCDWRGFAVAVHALICAEYGQARS